MMVQQDWWSRLKAWCETHPVQYCVVFGSQATGKTHAGSDIDVAIRARRAPTGTEKLQWIVDLETALDKPVSLVWITPDLNPTLGYEIARVGILICEAEVGVWQLERARLWHLYNDAAPLRRRARQQLLEYARKVLDGA